MRAKMGIDVSALQQALAQLPKQMQGQVQKNALRAGARVIRDEAKAKAPVDTGALRDSIVVRAPTSRQKRRGVGPVVVGFKQPTGRRAHLAEFGTARQAPQPFLRPAILARGDDAIRAIGKQLGKALEGSAKKLSGRRGRKAFKRGLGR